MASVAKVVKSEEEWKRLLGPERYRILRQDGTEPAFHNQFWNNHEPGTYVCGGCGNPLFSSDDKFDSGTGWPSFIAPIDKNAVTSGPTAAGWSDGSGVRSLRQTPRPCVR